MTCLIYVPRERYDSSLRARFQAVLENAYKGKAERSLIIEIVNADERTVEATARAIRAINSQKTVLMMSLHGQAKKII